METKKDELVYATGYLGKDPVERETRANVKVASVQIGVKKGEETTWVQISAFGEKASELMELKKGDKVTVSGQEKLSPKTVEDKTYDNKYIEVTKIDTHKVLTVNGNLLKDPEHKSSEKASYMEFAIAQNLDGGKTEIFNVRLLDPKTIESGKDLKKGDFVKLEGDVKFSSYEKDGVKQSYREMIPFGLTVLKEKTITKDEKKNDVKDIVKDNVEKPKISVSPKRSKGVSM